MFTRTLITLSFLTTALALTGCNRNAVAEGGVTEEPYEEPDEEPGEEPGATAVVYDDDFSVWNTDEDEYLTTQEWEAGLETWDLDDDGLIEESEYLYTDFDTYDLDDDGYLNDEELDAMYAAWDLDNDGYLDTAEFWP